MTKFMNKSFSVPGPGISQDKWDSIFKKDSESKRGVLRACDACGLTKYTWKVEGENLCNSCIEASGIQREVLLD